MGIPRLTRHLEPFAESVVLGCPTRKCEKHPVHQDIIIDGPSLAYYIYHRILAHKPIHLAPMDAIPSYNELGKATLTFLDEMVRFGTVVRHIYFDGGLPSNKRETRKSRLEASLQQLLFSHKKFPNGFKVCIDTVESPQVTALQIFDSTCCSPFPSKQQPSPPFIVPAVLDALSASPYASVTSVVFGEADLFCARAVKERGGFILTSDSDLLLYDLGSHGAVIFFNQLGLRGAHSSLSKCDTLEAFVKQPSEIASRLGFDDLRYIAFEIAQDSSLSLAEAVRRAEQLTEEVTEEKALERKFALENFFNAYDTKSSNPEFCQRVDMTYAADGLKGSFLDPRISEFLSRCPSSASMYLPFLTDDPSRTSAWDVSCQLRYFTYSCLALGDTDLPDMVFEHVRRGSRLVEDKAEILSHEGTVAFAQILVDKFEALKGLFHGNSRQHIWRLSAIHGVYCWYLDEGKTPPSKETMAAAFSGITGQLSWIEIHVSAQMQAFLYAFRMLNQILSHLNAKVNAEAHITNSNYGDRPPKQQNLPPELLQLQKILSTLPLLNELIPSRLELASHSLPAAKILKTMQDIQEMTDSPQNAFEKGSEERADPNSFNLEERSNKKKRKRYWVQDKAKKKPIVNKAYGENCNRFNALPLG